jgi:V/A-type H+-transporting ATPase subunit E
VTNSFDETTNNLDMLNAPKDGHKIIERIISDATSIATSTLEEGKIKADEIIADAENNARIYIENARREFDTLSANIIERKKNIAMLEVRKWILKAKKDVLDKAFEKALERLLQLKKDKYLKIIDGMLEYAEDGDIVCISEKDKRTITKKFITDYAVSRGIKLNVSSESVNIDAGLILISTALEKDLSFKSELSLLRDEIESEIALILFGK